MITYKNITEVEVVNEIPENATALINDGGELKQAALDLKALDYNNLTKVEAIEELPENAKAIINDNGTLKQVECKGFGGGNDIATAIITQHGPYQYSCENMTFGEAAQIMQSSMMLKGILKVYEENMLTTLLHSVDIYYNMANDPPYICFGFICDGDYDPVFLSEYGIAHEVVTNQPK